MYFLDISVDTFMHSPCESRPNNNFTTFLAAVVHLLPRHGNALLHLVRDRHSDYVLILASTMESVLY